MRRGEAPAFDFPVDEFRGLLRTWYKRHARRLPWRGAKNPYGTWLSEIMLQQTRVATVIERYRAFMDRFPSISALAHAKEDDVLALWSGLGYYRRARMLLRAAQFVERELGGRLPRKAEKLRTLPGIGEYTAAAIASIAYGEGIAVLDGNVERVLLRILGQAEDATAAARARLVETAQALVPPRGPDSRTNFPGDHNQAMMELGATICTPRSPLCLECPVMRFCKTRGEHVTLPRQAQQSREVAHLLETRETEEGSEVLLAWRSSEASLMAGMIELPPLPMEAVENREPVLRLRHSITHTNYYVQIFTEENPAAPLRAAAASRRRSKREEPELPLEPVTKPKRVKTPAQKPQRKLLEQVPLAESDLQWVATSQLPRLPLTGLARKALQRLRVMAVS